MIARLLRKFSGKSWLAFFLILGAVGSAASALGNSIPNLRNAPLLNYSVYGVIVGWLISRSRLRLWWALPLGLVLGVGGILYGFGGLGLPLLALARSCFVFIFFLLRWSIHIPWKPDFLPSGESILLAAQEISTRSDIVIYRLYAWLNIGVHGHWMVDVQAVSILWSIILCLCAIWAGWMVFKACNPVLGVAPAGLLMAFVLNYTSGESLVVIFFLGSALLLFTLNLEIVNEARWTRGKIDFAEHIPQDVAIAGVVLTIVFVLLASGAHAVEGLTFKDISNFFHRLRSAPAVAGEGGDTFAESMGLEPPTAKVSPFSEWSQPGLPRQHLLGSGPELSKRVVMVIKPDPASLSISTGGSEPVPPPRFYWRALTYDNYNGRGWIANDIMETTRTPDTPLVATIPDGWQAFHASVRGVEDLANLLYYTGDLVNTDKDYVIAERPINPGPGAPLTIQKYIQNDIFGVRINAQNYQFDSILATASEKSLRATGINYPQWITSRYLGLPDNTPTRLLMLAIGLTENKSTPYDKALAIQDYLRMIPYSLDVPEPPANEDVADYFIFDLKQGYCDYYATAMVVMARAVHIPARLVMGYASGTYDPVNRTYVVSEADAHSWPELYFPGIGWVEFEPTASQPAIQRPPDLTPIIAQEATSQVRRYSYKMPSWPDILFRVGLAALAIYLLVDLWSTADLLRMRRMSPQAGILRIYRRLYRQARPLTGHPGQADTPLEYSSTLQDHILELKSQPSEDIYFNVILQRIRSLTGVYVQSLFSPHAPGKPEFEQAIQNWKKLRRELVSLRIRQFYKKSFLFKHVDFRKSDQRGPKVSH